MNAVDKPPIVLGLEALLKAAAGLTALTAERIYWKRAPHNADYPLLVFRRQGGEPVHAFGTDSGLQLSRWLFIGIGSLAEHADAVMVQTKAAINRVKDTTVAGVFIDSIFLDDALDVDLGADTQDEAVGQVYRVNYRES